MGGVMHLNVHVYVCSQYISRLSNTQCGLSLVAFYNHENREKVRGVNNCNALNRVLQNTHPSSMRQDKYISRQIHYCHERQQYVTDRPVALFRCVPSQIMPNHLNASQTDLNQGGEPYQRLSRAMKATELNSKCHTNVLDTYVNVIFNFLISISK